MKCLGALMLGSLLSAASLDESKEFEVMPLVLPWEDLSPDVFDVKWVLPDPRVVPGRDVLAEMRRLQELRFDLELPDGSRHFGLGDLVEATQGQTPAERDAWFEQLAQAAPRLYADWGSGLSQLLRDDELHGPRWKPSRDLERDGMLFADNWSLRKEPKGPWGGLRVNPKMEQSAALLRADLATIKAIENDYRTYPDNVGADYRDIYPLDDSYFIGRDASGRRYSALTIRFRCDLPFPFSGYTTRLNILNRFDAAGVLSTDIYSTSKDFYWLAGRDVFLPVKNSKGEWVAQLVVRHFGFDLDGVPDGPENRREAIRSSLGNLKRKAERLYRERPSDYGPPRNDQAMLHGVRVYGSK